jgi:cyclic pyranopterin phosphate synthase|tara:strand:+ start:2933 stop:3829 length:897 start_codon:yes stop_codon:yes gene_type:complete
MPDEKINFYPNSKLMSADELLNIAKIFVSLGVKKIRLTGGEPLIRKDAREIIARLSNLPIELAITSNGYLIDEYLDLFHEVGLKSVNISLDTLDAEKFHAITKRNYLKKVLSNIKLFIDNGFHVKINMVALKGVNLHEIKDFVQWTKNERIHVRFIEFMPFNGNSWDFSKIVSYKEVLNIVEENFEFDRIQDAKNDTAKNYRLKDGKGTFAVISSITDSFCSTCNRIRLTADGKIKNCLFSNAELDLLTSYRKGDDIEELIFKNIESKFAERGGFSDFKELKEEKDFGKGRCMFAIGG